MSSELKDEAFELLDRLKDELLPEKDGRFVAQMLERREEWGDEMLVSRKQVFWLRDIAERLP